MENFRRVRNALNQSARNMTAGVSKHDWGCWSQSVEEVELEIDLEPGTKGKDVIVTSSPSFLEVKLAKNSKTLLSGKLFELVKGDETEWTIEEKKTLRIVLQKAEFQFKEIYWTSLMKNGDYSADAKADDDMRAFVNFERFQMASDGRDFSTRNLDLPPPPGYKFSCCGKIQK